MKRLHLECLPDERLVTKIGFTRKEVHHHNDKGRVCNQLAEQNGLIGMVDEDPSTSQPAYVTSLKSISGQHNIKVFNDTKRGNKLIMICPRLEEWIIAVCNSNDVDITRFGLSSSGSKLHRQISGRLPSFDKLLTHLIELKAPQLLHLKELLQAK